MIFLQWIPWLLRMSRPGEKITRKSILMQKKIKELDKTEVKQDKVYKVSEHDHAMLYALYNICRCPPRPY